MKKTTTRKILLSLAFCFALMSARGQYVTIPDNNFANLLDSYFPSCMNGNQMDTTCSAIANATVVNFWNASIQNLDGIQYFDNLQELYCGGNLLTFLPPLPPLLESLKCSGNQLTSLITLPNTLHHLECADNQLTVLPLLPNNLEFLNCFDNQITSLSPLPNNLDTLSCGGNPINSLPPLPSSLKILNCNYCYLLTNWPALPNSLTEFYCDEDTLSLPASLPDSLRVLHCWQSNFISLPPLPDSLKELYCRDNQLTNLPPLPSRLEMLECGENYLTSLPSLPSTLLDLKCYANQITNLPSIPNSLIDLFCFANPLDSLPVLPNTLVYLSCGSNQLTFLPNLPTSLLEINCSYNQLTVLPTLPLSMSALDISYNSGLTCLPAINHIDNFTWNNTGITCLPNSLTVGLATPSIANVPLCAFSNTNNCPVYWSISGKTFTDVNSNCLADTNEVLLRNLKVKLYSGGILKQQAFSNNLGQYAFTADTGNYVYQIDTVSLPFNVICPPTFSFATYLTNGNPQNPNKDYSLECKTGFDVGVASVIRKSGNFHPGNITTVNFLAGDISSLYNKHCATGVSGIVIIIINGPASFVSASAGALTPIVNGDSLVYTISDFGTVNFQNDFSFIVQTDTTAQAGQQVCFDVSVTPLAGDNNTTNNNYSQCFTVANSYDPNEKEVYPSGSIDTSQHELTYTIYFQNTGNDTAQHVYVLDTLDNAIDESSIKLLAYSHEPMVQVVGKIVKFNFPNINLPDSTTDEPNSHGNVQYRVRIKNNAVVGTQIHNTAFIYFDFNNPVVTNTTFNQIDIITDLTPDPSPMERGTVADIYPNPIVSGGELKIVFNSSTATAADFTIYDMSGRTVFSKSIFSSPQTQNIAFPQLSEGIYNCVFSYSNGSSHKKLVVVNK